MKQYLIRRAQGPVALEPKAPAWASAERLAIDVYPWYVKGDKQATEAAALYDEQAIYVLFNCRDRHIHSVATAPNGEVWLDSCVEFFFAPAGRENGYINCEINCCGAMMMGFGTSVKNRRLADAQIHSAVKIATSIPGKTKEESPDDNGWWAAVRLPFAPIAKFSGLTVAPKSGDVWHANLYRCGGKTDPQYACWNPINVKPPNFHLPEFFGEAMFE